MSVGRYPAGVGSERERGRVGDRKKVYDQDCPPVRGAYDYQVFVLEKRPQIVISQGVSDL